VLSVIVPMAERAKPRKIEIASRKTEGAKAVGA
jgi:hypothetical protein